MTTIDSTFSTSLLSPAKSVDDWIIEALVNSYWAGEDGFICRKSRSRLWQNSDTDKHLGSKEPPELEFPCKTE